MSDRRGKGRAPLRAGASGTAATRVPAPAPAHARRKRSPLVTAALVGVLLLGLVIYFYPTLADWWNSFHQSRALMSYASAVGELDEARRAQMLQDAEAYNERLAQTGQQWTMTDEQAQEYERQLDVDGTGIMGMITIPKINVKLPLYHGTDDAVLQTSIGHLAGTALPVGGPSTHCVLSGHRGLPSARLFTDLDQLVEGDTFTLTVLDETLTYEVDQIRVVEPTDLSDLQVEEGQDLCTLVTCTPYGINTQRLLVRGHRVANPDGDAQVIAEAVQVQNTQVACVLAVPALAALVTIALVRSRRRDGARATTDAFLAERGLERPDVLDEEASAWLARDGRVGPSRDAGDD